jgi:phosphoenolpyruvate carboxykinase (ATP)
MKGDPKRVENVALNQRTRRLDLDDDALTENTRAAYPITHLPNIVADGTGPVPRHVIMLTADAFGVLPPIARLTPEQAMYHFLSGYTAKVAGTERGVTEPTATFSTLFGAPFMPLHPTVYADLFGKLVAANDVACWLVNTGWTGGPFGTGHRMEIAVSRAVIRAVLSGELTDADMTVDPVFGFSVPHRCAGVPDVMLRPRDTWSDPDAYDTRARELAARFVANFQQFAGTTTPEVIAAGPHG